MRIISILASIIYIILAPEAAYSANTYQEYDYKSAIDLITSKDNKKIIDGINMLFAMGSTGNIASIVELSRIYMYGFPVLQRPQIIKENKVLSYSYAMIASHRGSVDGKSIINMSKRWSRILTKEQKKEATAIANNWRVGIELPRFSRAYIHYNIIKYINNDTILIRGPIYDGAYGDFMSAVGDNIKYVILDSDGGNIEDGVKIGLEIEKRSLTAIVDGACLSACANYLFIGASHRIVKNDSIVCFHGGAPKPRDIEEEFSIKDTDTDNERKEKISKINDLVNKNKKINNMEYELIDKYKINRSIVDLHIMSIIPNKYKAVNTKYYVVMSCPGKIILNSMGIKTDYMWYNNIRDDDLLKLGREYNWKLFAVPKMIIFNK